ncbi:peptidoglycan-binding domain-containing protein [Kaistia terrae]|uniref:Peptidoglycan-binding protein n=1 Tax=Kaistia terrae TaxID=537017 RepID=A0ABW0Q4H9_9HYPH|nr:peptidoglycan-binding domain-containing protein [Kaistia terrae]MCX5581494.1 peptidoglycan-binding domain-containing protein [Kaistia terrae]
MVTLAKGMRSAEVAKLQQALVDNGYDVKVDGHFGEKTQKAVQAFQRSANIRPDGAYGQRSAGILQPPLPRPDPSRQFPPMQPAMTGGGSGGAQAAAQMQMAPQPPMPQAPPPGIGSDPDRNVTSGVDPGFPAYNQGMLAAGQSNAARPPMPMDGSAVQTANSPMADGGQMAQPPQQRPQPTPDQFAAARAQLQQQMQPPQTGPTPPTPEQMAAARQSLQQQMQAQQAPQPPQAGFQMPSFIGSANAGERTPPPRTEPRLVQFEGKTIAFPPDATDDEIQQALASPPTHDEALAQMSELSRIKPEDKGQLEAFRQGARQGVTFGFGDEIAAGAKTGFGLLGDYGKQLNAERGDLLAAREHHPYTTGASEIGGALATAAIPGMGGLNVIRGAGTGARIGNAAATGAVAGGLYGAGAADGDLGDRAVGAAIGAGSGAVIGGAIPAVVAGAKVASRPITRPIAAALDPQAAASKRVGAALQRDGVTPQQAQQTLQQAQQSGAPLVVADTGGETTRALARSAANSSPEGRAAIDHAVNSRFETQGDRTEGFVRGLVRRASADQTADDLKAAARRVNGPAYANAYLMGPVVWDKQLEHLTTSPAVQRAIRDATKTGANRATADGFKPPVNPFVPDGAGGLKLRVDAQGNRSLPSLQFWDHVQRNLADDYDVAIRKGANSAANDIKDLKNQLLGHLDTKVPEFQKARQGASAFFGAQDALEAGQNFVTSKVENEAARKAVAAMNKPEKELFAEGFASDLIGRIRESGDRRNIANSIFFNSKAARERVEIALGKQKAAELEAFVRAENTMDLLRRAVQGNSTTARQLAELGLAGGASTVINGGFNPTDPSWLMTTALVRGGRLAGTTVEQRTVRRIAEMLASNDPKVLNQAAVQLSLRPGLMKALRAAEENIGRIVGPASVEGGLPAALAGDNRDPLSVTVSRPANWDQAKPNNQ